VVFDDVDTSTLMLTAVDKDVSGPGTCTNCPHGKFYNGIGATALSVCRDCAINTYASPDGSGCLPCPDLYTANALTSDFKQGHASSGCIKFVEWR